jgi:hypothetical protein
MTHILLHGKYKFKIYISAFYWIYFSRWIDWIKASIEAQNIITSASLYRNKDFKTATFSGSNSLLIQCIFFAQQNEIIYGTFKPIDHSCTLLFHFSLSTLHMSCISFIVHLGGDWKYSKSLNWYWKW